MQYSLVEVEKWSLLKSNVAVVFVVGITSNVVTSMRLWDIRKVSEEHCVVLGRASNNHVVDSPAGALHDFE